MFKFRVMMRWWVDGGESFNFACFYQAANGNAAGKMAIREWDGIPIIEIKRVAQ